MRRILFLIVLTLAVVRAAAQTPCSCCTPQHRQFDFWLGEWEVYDTTGTLVGHNNLVLMQDSCLMQENWTGSRGGTGTSYNYYDQTDKSWNQLWIDNQGSVLKLKGTYFDNKMVLEKQH